MKIILVNRHQGHTRSFLLDRTAKAALALSLLLLTGGLVFAGYQLALASNPHLITEESAKDWDRQLLNQSEELLDLREHSEMHVDALTVRLAMLQARLARLEGVGERVVHIAGLEEGEFDFSREVGVGGPYLLPEGEGAVSYTFSELSGAIAALDGRIDDRRQQLAIIEGVLEHRKIDAERSPGGWPVGEGWISSNFGHRPDPLNGRRAFHGGVDFTGGGIEGADIISVASGVVTWSGPRTTLGLLVEIEHGNGYVTRYAHASKVLVEVGDKVDKGQIIARVGSTGRSTGAHLHFEVYKDGRHVNPESFINRQ